MGQSIWLGNKQYYQINQYLFKPKEIEVAKNRYVRERLNGRPLDQSKYIVAEQLVFTHREAAQARARYTREKLNRKMSRG